MTARFSSTELTALLERSAWFRSAPAAMRAQLLEAGALRRVLKVPQEDFALMLALSRQTINQVLKQFETQGALKRGYAEIEIADVKKLSAPGGLNPVSD
jgi:hypothetical protein